MRRGWWAYGLWPLSQLLWWAHQCRAQWLAPKPAALERLSVPLVVVGNIYVGGVGKTPIVLALIEHLQAQGLQVGVLARGYGSTNTGEHILERGADAKRWGDEPVLIHERTGVPVVVGVERVRAARLLLAQFPQTQVLLSDDGLQRLKHWADATLCVFDERGLGNGFTLPAGPLREPWPRQQAHHQPHSEHTREWVIHSQAGGAAPGSGTSTPPTHRPPPPFTPGFVAQRYLKCVARNAKGETLDLMSLVQAAHTAHTAHTAQTTPISPSAPTPPSAPSQHPAHRIVALAGIAKPAQFFEMLGALGLTLGATLCASDHASASELMGLLSTELGLARERVTLLCTEKDAAKLWPLYPQAWSVALGVKLEPLFLEEFDLMLRHRLSSTHGHETH